MFLFESLYPGVSNTSSSSGTADNAEISIACSVGSSDF